MMKCEILSSIARQFTELFNSEKGKTGKVKCVCKIFALYTSYQGITTSNNDVTKMK